MRIGMVRLDEEEQEEVKAKTHLKYYSSLLMYDFSDLPGLQVE